MLLQLFGAGSFHHGPRVNQLDSRVASPKKLANPLTSVTVVKMMDEAVAGSRLSAVSTIGTEQPLIAAMIIEPTIDTPITDARPKL